jgi:hypothetical protein
MNYQLNPEMQSGTVYFHTNDGKPESITFTVGEEQMLQDILDCIRAETGVQPDRDATDLNEPDPLVPFYDGGYNWMIPKSEADDVEHFDEFEKAADAAEKEKN